MIVYIVNSKARKQNLDGIVLTENDFNPCHPFFISHPQIQPESVDKIIMKGVLECYDCIRAVFRFSDYMLKVGGQIEIHYYAFGVDKRTNGYVRIQNEWQYELSLVFADRIHQLEMEEINGHGHFVYQKVSSSLPEYDTIERWSFGIISNGRDNEGVLRTINQIEAFGIPEYEVIICGPSPTEDTLEHVKILSDEGMYPDIRIPISKKKNYILSQARYNNVMIIHDRISFAEDWYEKMKKHSNYFDLLCCSIVNIEDGVTRMADWIVTNLKPIRNGLCDVINGRQSGDLPTEKWSHNLYVAGGVILMKKHFGLELNPNLYWGEREDVDFSYRAYYKGMLITYTPYNHLFSKPIRFGTKEIDNRNIVRKKLGHIKYQLTKILDYYKEKRKFHDFINQGFSE